jgi:hypothetical protein
MFKNRNKLSKKLKNMYYKTGKIYVRGKEKILAVGRKECRHKMYNTCPGYCKGRIVYVGTCNYAKRFDDSTICGYRPILTSLIYKPDWLTGDKRYVLQFIELDNAL